VRVPRPTGPVTSNRRAKAAPELAAALYLPVFPGRGSSLQLLDGLRFREEFDLRFGVHLLPVLRNAGRLHAPMLAGKRGGTIDWPGENPPPPTPLGKQTILKREQGCGKAPLGAGRGGVLRAPGLGNGPGPVFQGEEAGYAG